MYVVNGTGDTAVDGRTGRNWSFGGIIVGYIGK